LGESMKRRKTAMENPDIVSIAACTRTS
jgi:hypothetical protein